MTVGARLAGEGDFKDAFAGKPGSCRGNVWLKSVYRVLFTIVHCQSLNCSIVHSRLFISVQQRTRSFLYLQDFQAGSKACNFWHESRSTAQVA
jgi:hypothetical protein